MCVGVEFLAFNVLLHIKSVKKYYLFCAPMILLITIWVGRVWIVIRYFLFEKQAFNGLLKVIGIQN